MSACRKSKAALKDLCTLVTDGTHDSPNLQPKGIPFIKAKHVLREGIDFDNSDFISYEDHLKVIARSKPERGDILFVNIGAGLGNAAYVNTDIDFSIKNVALFKPDSAKINSRYLFYIVTSKEFQDGLKNRRSGSAQPFVGLDTLRSHVLEYHSDLRVQEEITSILSAYDDLIENNTRRIEILEEMAQAIYREWFVHFRFPGHEKVRMVDSHLGLIPEGWELTPFSGVADFVNGYAFKPNHWGVSGKPIIKIAELKNGVTSSTPRYHGEDIAPKYYIQNGDLLFSWSADLNAYIWSGGDALLNQHLFNVVPKGDVSRLFLFYALKDRMQEFRSRSQGTTMRHIKRSALDEVKLTVPPSTLRSAFDQCVEPIIKQVENLQTKNTNLRRTRDLLLPKLVSGEVDLEGVEVN